MVEHLTDIPPTCLPLNSDSMWCLSSINIDRDTHVILRTGLTRWYYECCCGKWWFIFISGMTLYFNFAVLAKEIMEIVIQSNYFKLVATYLQLFYTPTSSNTLYCYCNGLLIWCNSYINRFTMCCISTPLKVFLYLCYMTCIDTQSFKLHYCIHTLRLSVFQQMTNTIFHLLAPISWLNTWAITIIEWSWQYCFQLDKSLYLF